MHRMTILYPAGDGTTFDFEYYTTKHMPMVLERSNGTASRFEVAKSTGALGGGAAPYIAIGTLYIEDLDKFNQAFMAAAGDVMADVPNYTNSQPVVQIDEIVG